MLDICDTNSLVFIGCQWWDSTDRWTNNLSVLLVSSVWEGAEEGGGRGLVISLFHKQAASVNPGR